MPLFAPWRAAHIARATDAARDGRDSSGSAPDGPGLFARLAAADPADDARNLVLHRGQTCFVVLNRYPYTGGHLMVVPYREVAAYDALSPEERAELAELTARAMGWLRTAYRPDGFNVGINQGEAAGAGIPRHLHQHVVPRWHGDTNFMTSVGGERVIPESLEQTYQRLHKTASAG
ncbi:MAG: HIT family protein [Rubricoccaceae bacterium]